MYVMASLSPRTLYLFSQSFHDRYRFCITNVMARGYLHI